MIESKQYTVEQRAEGDFRRGSITMQLKDGNEVISSSIMQWEGYERECDFDEKYITDKCWFALIMKLKHQPITMPCLM